MTLNHRPQYLLCVLLVAAIANACGRSAYLASSAIDAFAIRQVRLGMTVEEVVAILGQPFSIEPKPIEFHGPDASTMNYSKRVPSAWSYPMLWVHLKNRRVVEVYAKSYVGWDDRGVYGLSRERQWEAADFESIFPVR
jgi:hypothetical protein